MPVTIGIIGSIYNREVQRVREALRQKKARVVVADLSRFPALLTATLGETTWNVGSRDFDRARVWLFRQLEVELPIPLFPDERQRLALRDTIDDSLVADREVRAFGESLIHSLVHRFRLVNDPCAAVLHRRKPALGALLRRAGIPVPRSLATTSREQALAFAEQIGGQDRVICKACAGGGETRLASAQLADDSSTLRGPLLFQERIVGRSLRTYVVGDQVITCSEVEHGDVVDWRTDQRGLTKVTPDRNLRNVLGLICSTTGLDYAGVDIELDAHGTPYVLDVNPSPLFASYERHSGHDVAGPLAAKLLELAAQ